ncbi:aldehyde ferredoxin oxidoreductase N-terminal domain-containing protein [Anaeromicrobium sediminis]|uniref:Aldehyde:ferredoxin oxidoreductase n=1 Tax=Anaeromicrobium sediminis TaxID=1478221 RepID=A0A267MN28_9FIRM|nr:aldehyde ferredoxin oxidoreductase N-terminal domain-containing protein [Anaeromicrobium sediminis]PAB60328.1 aldehyde:ferredoxin oxidoreductase [Anaeromicrobium sediminis]
MIYKDYKRVLYIDLSKEKIRIDLREDLQEYLGGVGIASKLLEENIKPDLEPLHEDQPIIFAIGACSSIFPVITKTVAMFYSPLTRDLGESYAGGRMAITLLFAGYDAVVITGKCRRPSYITIKSNDVEFKDARPIWGLSTSDTGRIIRERESGEGKRSILRIGPAGENLSSFACVCVDTYRHFGRLGLGACMGSKNLKSIVSIGDKSIDIENNKEYFKAYQTIYKKVTNTDIMGKYHDLGTSVNVLTMNEKGSLLTRNLKDNRFEHAEEISGEKFAEKNLIRKVACTSCPVGCIHIGQYRKQFDDGYDYEAISVAYDYELIFALGSYIGVGTTEDLIELIEKVEQLGFDAISAGVVLGWATEAYSNGLITNNETMLPLEFGNVENYIKALEYMGMNYNEFYKTLAKGCLTASKVYGGEEYAVQFAGNETPGYHTGYGSAVGHTVGSRHSHLCNGGYSIDQSTTEFDKEKLIEYIFNEERERCILNSLVICLFARKVYDRETILLALNSIGYNLTNDDLDHISDSIYKTKLRIKKMLDFDITKVKLPKRLFETDTSKGPIDEKTTYELISSYNEKLKEYMS